MHIYMHSGCTYRWYIRCKYTAKQCIRTNMHWIQWTNVYMQREQKKKDEKRLKWCTRLASICLNDTCRRLFQIYVHEMPLDCVLNRKLIGNIYNFYIVLKTIRSILIIRKIISTLKWCAYWTAQIAHIFWPLGDYYTENTFSVIYPKYTLNIFFECI